MIANKQKYLLLILIALSGCLKQKIVVNPEHSKNLIADLNPLDADWQDKKDEIFVLVKKYNRSDCYTKLQVDPTMWGYQPIQMTISNFSESNIYLKPSILGLNLIHPKTVAKKCKWPTLEMTSSAAGISAIFWWPGIIYSAVSSYGLSQRNKKITKNIVNMQTLQNHETIKIRPLDTLTKVIFVANDEMRDTFILSLFIKDKKDFIDFKVEL